MILLRYKHFSLICHHFLTILIGNFRLDADNPAVVSTRFTHIQHATVTVDRVAMINRRVVFNRFVFQICDRPPGKVRHRLPDRYSKHQCTYDDLPSVLRVTGRIVRIDMQRMLIVRPGQ